MTGLQAFEKTKKSRKTEPWTLRPPTVPSNISDDKTNCIGRFRIKNTIKSLLNLFL